MKKLLFLGVGILLMGILAFGQEMMALSDQIISFTSPTASGIAIIPAIEKYGQPQNMTPLGLYDFQKPLVAPIDKNGEQTLSYVNVTNIPSSNGIMVVWDGDTVVDVHLMQ